MKLIEKRGFVGIDKAEIDGLIARKKVARLPHRAQGSSDSA